MYTFSHLHPLSLLIYYVVILFLTMFHMHPLLLLASACGSISFFCVRNYRHLHRRDLLFPLFVAVLLAVTNPLFSHRGETVLFYLNNNPVTFEAIWYGFAAGVMLASVVLWCRTLQQEMTSDKITHLFGCCLPKAGMLLTTALRFIPHLKRQHSQIHNTMKTLGMYSEDTWFSKVRCSLQEFSILVTDALEGSVEIADSMNARGYQLKKHSHFSMFRFRAIDCFVLLCSIITMILMMIGSHADLFSVYYYPKWTMTRPSAISDWLCVGWMFLFSMLPTLIQIKETIKWTYYKSKI